MPKTASPQDHRKLLQSALWRTLLLPLLILVFFLAAPAWYNAKVHASIREHLGARSDFSESERANQLARFDQLDLQAACGGAVSGEERLRGYLEEDGVCRTFAYLGWGRFFSIVLVVVLGVTMLSLLSLNLDARKSPKDLIRNYQFSWKITMAAALFKLVLLIPLLSYASFEFMVLLSNHFLPKLFFIIIVGGLIALGACVKVLLKKVPMEFPEPMSREVAANEAPELWSSVRHAAELLQAAPPDRIVIGTKLSFYVTELAVITDAGRTTGRTLFLSYPLIKQLSRAEVLAIIGHELGHFKGDDTRMTREFYPLRLKVGQTGIALARAGWIGWSSWGLVSFFNLTFEKTIREMSRQRELIADRIGAQLTSTDTFARALVRFQVLAETLQRILKEPATGQPQNPLDIGWHTFISEKILPADPFWTQLAEKKISHPLDTHPTLLDRLEALGAGVHVTNAREIALQPTETAYDFWFANRSDVFADLNQKVQQAVGTIQVRSQLTGADYETEAGRDLLRRHFPEVRWPKNGATTFLLSFLGLLGLFFLWIFFIIPGSGKVAFGLAVLIIGWIAWAVWTGRKGELVMNADGLTHPRWKRTLRFNEIERVELRRINSSLVLKLHLKVRQKTISKWNLPVSVNAALLRLSGYKEKPLVIAQAIHRYFTRQPLP
jgi:Zn-dependent protease with chaperone function